jgi:hypothetical protein
VERVVPLDYRAVAHDGTPLCNDAQGLDLGFFALKSDAQNVTFFVGTRAEFETLRRAELQGDGPSRTKPGNGSGGGRRGGGGKRNQTQTDPNSAGQ